MPVCGGRGREARGEVRRGNYKIQRGDVIHYIRGFQDARMHSRVCLTQRVHIKFGAWRSHL